MYVHQGILIGFIGTMAYLAYNETITMNESDHFMVLFQILCKGHKIIQCMYSERPPNKFKEDLQFNDNRFVFIYVCISNSVCELHNLNCPMRTL